MNCAKCQIPSSEDSQQLKACSKCKMVWYCSKKCQRGHWPIHKPICRPYHVNEIWGIKILCDGELAAVKPNQERARFQHVLLKDTQPEFSKAELCPVTELCGIPLRIYSQSIHQDKDASFIDRFRWVESNKSVAFRRIESEGITANGQNQPAVYLRIEPSDGFAPPSWQVLDPGTCIAVRQDRQPLTKETTETVWKWHAKLLASPVPPTPDGWAPIRELMTPSSFECFAREYHAEQRKKGRPGFDQVFAFLSSDK